MSSSTATVPQALETQARQELQAHSLRITGARLAVLRLLLGAGRAFSHRDLEDALPDHDRATLYRTLQSFEESGLVHRVLDETGRAFFAPHAHCPDEAHAAPSREADPHQHVHFKCRSCGSILCLEGLPLPKLQVPASYKAEQTEVLVHGLCPACAETT